MPIFGKNAVMFKILKQFGAYFFMLRKTFTRPQKMKIFFRRFFEEVEAIGLDSLAIVAILSLFMGAVVLIQSAYNFQNPLIPEYAEGLATRDSMLLEFSPTIISLILVGKVGSSIASELGTMRVTEQIDALQIMGVDPMNYLVLPKIVAGVFIIPFLIVISMFLGVYGGYLASLLTDAISPGRYIYGIQYGFEPYYVFYALVKTAVFAFILTSVSSFHGYNTHGGALEVGKSSTKAVVYSTIVIIFFNLVLTKLLLN
jgi:phospholipid/cholesterol/gamma-HCH transport system permease protein